MRVSGKAPMFAATRGPSRRGLRLWIARAINSFPVPPSPWISTMRSESATWRMHEKTSRIAALWPIISGNSPAWASRSRSSRFSFPNRWCSYAFRT